MMPRRLFTRAAAFLALAGAMTGSVQAQRVAPVTFVIPAVSTVRLAPTASPPTPAALPSVPTPLAAPEIVQAHPLNLLFLGPPGVGKTTFGKLASRDYGMVHISVGELLRAKALQDPSLAQTMAQGELVDSELVRRVVIERLSQPDVKQRGFILDGFPRRPEEAGVIESWLREGGSIDALIHLEAPDAELQRRILARGRMDDSEEIFRKRLEIYRQRTRPVLERFRGGLNVLEAETDGPDIPANYAKVRVLLDGLFDGGGRQSPASPSDQGTSSPVNIERRLAHGRYEASALGAKAVFTLKDGVLRAEVAGKGEAGTLDPGAELTRALGVFGRGVRAVRGEWARQTAHAAGFTVEYKEAGAPIFVRPEEVVFDRAGKPWRRTLKKSKGAYEWERYERGGRIVWLLRRAAKDGIAVYEFEGHGRPEPGTPAPRRAIFSSKEGRLVSDIVADGAILLDASVEARTAAETLLALESR